MKNKVLQELEQQLKKSRYEHTLRVRDMAIKIGTASQLDIEKVEVAALFHDLAKNLSNQELLDYIETHSVEVDNLVKRNLFLAHGMIAADIAKRDYHIHDDDILEAIAYHTIGKEGLGPIAKVIYVADYVEPERSFEGVEEIRKTACKGKLDKALLMSIEKQMTFLLKGHHEIHPNGLAMRNELVRKKKRGK